MDKKILVVDDEQDNVELLKFRLEANGFSVLEAENGPDAIRIAATETPDLILLDINLPGMDGYQVCRSLKENRDTQRIPVIILTCNTRESDLARGLSVGAVCFLTKPCNTSDLLVEINNALN